jgi:hypothetical protein
MLLDGPPTRADLGRDLVLLLGAIRRAVRLPARYAECGRVPEPGAHRHRVLGGGKKSLRIRVTRDPASPL